MPTSHLTVRVSLRNSILRDNESARCLFFLSCGYTVTTGVHGNKTRIKLAIQKGQAIRTSNKFASIKLKAVRIKSTGQFIPGV